MPDNKRQHYVPQFYFRLFSKDGKHIESYNLKRQASFTSRIDAMCKKDYFYSKDSKVEEVLSNLEGAQSSTINQLIADQKPPYDQKEYLKLLSFICVQHARTMTAKNRGDESMKLLSDNIVESLLGKSTDAEITFPKIHLLKMRYALQSIPLIGDLVPVVLINRTDNNFVFSDNPIVFHNTYLNDARDSGVLGLQSPGLQIFCPLGDKVMLMLYDPKFYSVNVRENYSLEITDVNDVKQLNALQFLNCDENIFYSDKSEESEIKSLHQSVKHLVGKRRMKMKVIQLPDTADGRKRELLHQYEERPKYELKLSFVTLNIVTDVGIVRNQEMIDRIYKDIEEADRYMKSKFLRPIYKIKKLFRRLKYRLFIRLGSN